MSVTNKTDTTVDILTITPMMLLLEKLLNRKGNHHQNVRSRLKVGVMQQALGHTAKKQHSTCIAKGEVAGQVLSVSRYEPPNESPYEAVKCHIWVLQSVYKSEDSWQNAVIGTNHANNFCAKAEIGEIRQRATFFCSAYQLALSEMNKWTWYKCFQEACDELDALGMTQATCYNTIASQLGAFKILLYASTIITDEKPRKFQLPAHSRLHLP
jgi:hypothetical protein